MIKLDKDGITLTGSRIELLTELGCIIHEMYKIGMNGTDEDKMKGILTDLICATFEGFNRFNRDYISSIKTGFRYRFRIINKKHRAINPVL